MKLHFRSYVPNWRHVDREYPPDGLAVLEAELQSAGVIYDTVTFVRNNYASGSNKIVPLVEFKFTEEHLTWLSNLLQSNRPALLTYLAERFAPSPDGIRIYPYKEKDWVELTDDFTTFDTTLHIMLEFLTYLIKEI